jgi:hypothetical protein
MKLSLLVSAVIAAAAILTGWHLDARIEAETAIHQRQDAEQHPSVATAGSATPATAGEAVPQGSSSGQLPGNLAPEFISFAQEMAVQKLSGEAISPALQARMVSVMGRVMELQPAQLKTLIDAVRTQDGLEEKLRQSMVCGLLEQMGKAAPAEALSLWRQSAEQFTDERAVRKFITGTLEAWSRQAPQAAMEWVKANGGAFPAIVNDEAKRRIAAITAASDPGLAFRMVTELNVSDRPAAVAEIVDQAAAHPQAQTRLLKALREFPSGNPDSSETARVLEAGMSRLGSAMASHSFAKGTAWIAAAGLDPTELAAFISGIPLGSEEGQWIDWTGNHLPSAQADPIIAKRVTKWTTADHRAAGEWLNALPPGSPVRETAVSAFAATVARYEPEAAERWALTLPEGPRRQETFRQIQANWPSGSPAADEAAKAFAQRHELP